MPPDDLTTARAVAERGGIAPPGLLLRLADRVEELEGLLRRAEWSAWCNTGSGAIDYQCCPFCLNNESAGHAPGCRLAAALGREDT